MKNDPLEQFYKKFVGKGEDALEQDEEPGKTFYVPRLEESPDKDPIQALWRRINLAESESVNLLTGFRGNGKSTELRRLKKRLEGSGCVVFLVDMLSYVFISKPIEITDFTLSLMAALDDAAKMLEETKGFKLASLRQNYWERLGNFLKTVKLDSITLKTSLADFGFTLKTDALFKAKVQEHLKGHFTEIKRQANAFVSAIVDGIQKQSRNDDLKVVLLVDSLEQLRGSGEEAQHVLDSVHGLFSEQAENLKYSRLHVVYTVPPSLQLSSANLGRTLGGNPLTRWPNIHVRTRTGAPDNVGLNIMKRIVEKRFPAWNEIIPENFIYQFATCSGGDIRDFFRLLREALIGLMDARKQNAAAVLNEEIAGRVIQQLKNEYLPIAEEDAKWLAKIHKSKEAMLPERKDLPDLTRFFDTNRIMNYLNGEPWYDVHPLVVEEIERMTRRMAPAQKD